MHHPGGLPRPPGCPVPLPSTAGGLPSSERPELTSHLMGTPPGAGLSPSRGPRRGQRSCRTDCQRWVESQPLTSSKDPSWDSGPQSGAGVGRGPCGSAPAFMQTQPSTLRASTSWTQSLGSGLVSFPRKPLPCETGEPGTGGPKMELSLLLPEIKQGRDWGPLFYRVREFPSAPSVCPTKDTYSPPPHPAG